MEAEMEGKKGTKAGWDKRFKPNHTNKWSKHLNQKARLSYKEDSNTCHLQKNIFLKKRNKIVKKEKGF